MHTILEFGLLVVRISSELDIGNCEFLEGSKYKEVFVATMAWFHSFERNIGLALVSRIFRSLINANLSNSAESRAFLHQSSINTNEIWS